MNWLFWVEKAQAADKFNAIGPATGATSTNYTFENFVDYIGNNAVGLITLIAGILAVLYLIWYGIQYITSGGSPDKAKAARQGVINAVIGIAVIVATYFLIRVAISIGNTLSGVAP